jgi:hypothetical protein
MKRGLKRALAIAAIVLAGAGGLAVRVVVEGRAALAEGDAALAAKRPADAIAAWETAARWYLPGAPHVDEAYARLVRLAGDPATSPPDALAAWRAVRGAARATRSLWTPHAEHLAAADAAIARLSADDPEASLAGGADHAARVAWHQRELARDPRPRPLAVALACFGIAAWLAGAAWLVRRGAAGAARTAAGSASTGSTARRFARRWRALAPAALTLAGLAAWALGLYTA